MDVGHCHELCAIRGSSQARNNTATTTSVVRCALLFSPTKIWKYSHYFSNQSIDSLRKFYGLSFINSLLGLHCASILTPYGPFSRTLANTKLSMARLLRQAYDIGIDRVSIYGINLDDIVRECFLPSLSKRDRRRES
mmetsp:Transcript_4189/g.12002  ORF Transcript_4189/g.12002 Transcript_4189/m.12002 type:complete len:137 (+) Transcript_4189:1472-1882(+)